jgi:hypothetical protein
MAVARAAGLFREEVTQVPGRRFHPTRPSPHRQVAIRSDEDQRLTVVSAEARIPHWRQRDEVNAVGAVGRTLIDEHRVAD